VKRTADRLASVVVTLGTIGSIVATAHTLVNLRQLRKPRNGASPRMRVSVVIPARNEAANVGWCLTSARGQLDVESLEILVADDGSTDGTRQVVEHHLADSRVRLIEVPGEPPPGWLGKSWACHQLAERASGEVLVFVDADVVLAPEAISAALALLDDADAVSPYPQQEAVTWTERLVQPLLQWSWLTFLPLGLARRSDRPSLTAANGQFLVITREAYDVIGGHAAVRGDVLEDLALFRNLKRYGRRGVIADGTTLASCRMYDGWPQLRDGYAKSLWSAFGSPAGAVAAICAMNLCYVVPPLAALRGSRVGAAGYLAGVVGRAAVARRVGGRVWPDSATQPASILAFSYLTAQSVRGRRQGTLHWKDRMLPL
jgi:hypothetical protein